MLQLSFSLLLLPVCVLSQMVPRVLYAPNSYEIQASDAVILPERYATVCLRAQTYLPSSDAHIAFHSSLSTGMTLPEPHSQTGMSDTNYFFPSPQLPVIVSGPTIPSMSLEAPCSVSPNDAVLVFRDVSHSTYAVYDAGAGDAADAVMLLTENGIQSAVMQLARAFHGAGVVMEHRYYGKSIPFVQKVRASPTSRIARAHCHRWPTALS
jgi:hypothetical protein